MAYPKDIMDFTDGVLRNTSVPTNAANKILRTDTVGRLLASSLVRSSSIIETDAELVLMKESKESFADVFNWWKRISRGGATYTDTYMPSELTSWQYKPATDSVVNPINSASTIGFISPDKLDSYSLDTQLSSTGGDDDFIGVIIAHATDPVDNTTHILTAIRGGNGLAPLVVDVDYYGYNLRRYSVAATYSGLTWCNGAVATPTNGTNGGNGTWNGAGIGCRLKITREGDIITIETSQFKETQFYEPATLVIDLSLDPKLQIFRGPQAYGYCAVSQPNATWVVSKPPEVRDIIVDIRDWSTWSFANDVWTKANTSKPDVIANGLILPEWLHQNVVTKKFFYLDNSNQLYRL